MRTGSSLVQPRVKCNGSSRRLTGARRQGSPAAVHYPHAETFYMKNVCAEGEEAILEVRLVEESTLMDATLGKAEISLSRLRGVSKTKQAEWHTLKKGIRDAGEVCVELQVRQVSQGTTRGKMAGATTKDKYSLEPDAAGGGSGGGIDDACTVGKYSSKLCTLSIGKDWSMGRSVSFETTICL